MFDILGSTADINEGMYIGDFLKYCYASLICFLIEDLTVSSSYSAVSVIFGVGEEALGW